MTTENFMQVGAQQGWQCPVCKRILSPWTPECPCRGQGPETIWTTTTTGNTETFTVAVKNSMEEDDD